MFFDLEEMNRLRFFSRRDAPNEQGFRDILVTEPTHPYIEAWWPPGHIIGYEHTFIHQAADFMQGIAENKPVAPTFRDGLNTDHVTDAVLKSAKTRQWEKVATS